MKNGSLRKVTESLPHESTENAENAENADGKTRKMRMTGLRMIGLRCSPAIRRRAEYCFGEYAVRFQIPNSVSFLALTEFRGQNSVSSSQPIIIYLCVKANSPSFWQNSPSLPQNSVRLSEFSSPKQHSRNSIPLPFPTRCGPALLCSSPMFHSMVVRETLQLLLCTSRTKTWRTFQIFLLTSSVSGAGKGRKSPRRKGGHTFY